MGVKEGWGGGVVEEGWRGRGRGRGRRGRVRGGREGGGGRENCTAIARFFSIHDYLNIVHG